MLLVSQANVLKRPITVLSAQRDITPHTSHVSWYIQDYITHRGTWQHPPLVTLPSVGLSDRNSCSTAERQASPNYDSFRGSVRTSQKSYCHDSRLRLTHILLNVSKFVAVSLCKSTYTKVNETKGQDSAYWNVLHCKKISYGNKPAGNIALHYKI
jgi:hypothetical protein